MSKIGNYIVQQEEAGELIYVEGRGYVKTEDYAYEFMKTDQYQKEFDKAFNNPKEQIDDIINGLKGRGL
jgi:hypothetical protein